MRVVVMLAALAIAGSVIAAGADPRKPANPNKRTCRSATSTGSRLPVSTCHTEAEWQAIDAAKQTGVQDRLDVQGSGGR